MQYRQQISFYRVVGNSNTIPVIREELDKALSGLLDINVTEASSNQFSGLLVGTKDELSLSVSDREKLNDVGDEGYLIITAMSGDQSQIIITANTDIGLLYGTFNFLKLLQTHQDISNLSIVSSPKIDIRILNHWD